jgi:hypothetical protein
MHSYTHTPSAEAAILARGLEQQEASAASAAREAAEEEEEEERLAQREQEEEKAKQKAKLKAGKGEVESLARLSNESDDTTAVEYRYTCDAGEEIFPASRLYDSTEET